MMTTARLARAAAAAALLVAAAPAAGQRRPSEEELFGAPAREEAPAEKAGTGGERAAPEETPRPEESQLFGAPPAAQAAPPPAPVFTREKEDPLRLGGQLYLRATTAWAESQPARDWTLSSPNLLDVYLDVRPNDRVRGFALGRMSYDPTIGPGTLGPLRIEGAGSGVLAGVRAPANPQAVLDQLWVNFDLGRALFVTAGRQHAKWGVGRFWNPTDYLHPVRRDPLAVYDVRTGTTLVKLHLPWEARAWNLYGVGVLEDVAGDTLRRPDGTVDGANRLGRIGAGGRAEVVLGTVELGADALVQDGHRPRFGVDVSAGVWDVDVYAEAALRTSVDTPRWRAIPDAPPTLPLLLRYERRDPDGFLPQVTVGANYSVKYSDEDAVTFGAEYFYDRSGYDSAAIYPALLGVAVLSQIQNFTLPDGSAPPNPLFGEKNPFTPFYLGRHYAGAYVSLPSPGGWNHTSFALSALGNLSDKSFVVRLDHSLLALTYLRVETFVAGHAGAKGGEFRLAFDVSPEPAFAGGPAFGLFVPAPVLEAGIAVRVSL